MSKGKNGKLFVLEARPKAAVVRAGKHGRFFVIEETGGERLTGKFLYPAPHLAWQAAAERIVRRAPATRVGGSAK